MSQLDDLVKFIKSHVPEQLMQEFDNWMDEPELIASHKGLGLDQRRLGVLTYEGVLSWDRFPFAIYDPQILFALILVWLANNSREGNFTLKAPVIDLEQIDDKVAGLTIRLGLADEICVSVDEKGSIPFDGQSWSISSPIIWTAESAQIFSADNVGANVTGSESD